MNGKWVTSRAMGQSGRVKTLIIVFVLGLLPLTARAEIDGHGPDAWRVTGVSANDVLNARMGPGTNYSVIETFGHDERGMQQITCVPLLLAAHYLTMSQAQIDALPPRWCLMRSADLTKAGWVAQRFIRPDDAVTSSSADGTYQGPLETTSAGTMIDEAEAIVRDLYGAMARFNEGQGPYPLRGPSASRYFTSDIVDLLHSGGLGADPLYGSQDFDGKVLHIASDADQRMLRGMITINVDFINFGRQQRAVFSMRADTSLENAPLRIFRVEHEGWSYP